MALRDPSLRTRQRIGQEKLPAFLQKVAIGLDSSADSISLTTLEEADRLALLFGEARMRAFAECGRPGRLCFETSDREKVVDFLGAALGTFPQTEIYLLRTESRWCGAIHARSPRVFDRAMSLINLDGEDLLALTSDGSAGVFLAWMTVPNARSEPERYRCQIWY
jgi:hypothetical protein